MLKPLSLATATAVVFALSASSYAAEDQEKGELKADLIACPHDGTILGGVNSCGKIWALTEGHVRLSSDGKLKVELEGLVLNDPTLPSNVNGTPDGVTAVVASVICGGSGGAIQAQTDLVPITSKGNAKISATVTLPKPCKAPVVIIREFFDNKIGGWLATIGI